MMLDKNKMCKDIAIMLGSEVLTRLEKPLVTGDKMHLFSIYLGQFVSFINLVESTDEEVNELTEKVINAVYPLVTNDFYQAWNFGIVNSFKELITMARN